MKTDIAEQMKAEPADTVLDEMKSRHLGDWFLTFTGRKFYPMDPQPADICIRDIAHHLSLLCRFNGAVREFYSVAQHSCLVACHLPLPLRLIGLMHDATEAYVGDMVRPLKRSMPHYRTAEEFVWVAIQSKFGFGVTDNVMALVKRADNMALMTERRDLLIQSSHPWSNPEKPWPEIIQPWSPALAEQRFLRLFDELTA